MSQIVLLPQNQVYGYLPLITNFLLKCFKKIGPRSSVTLEDVITSVSDGKYDVWLVLPEHPNDMIPLALVLGSWEGDTYLLHYTSSWSANQCIDLEGFIKHITEYVRERGGKELGAWCARPGWIKRYHPLGFDLKEYGSQHEYLLSKRIN